MIKKEIEVQQDRKINVFILFLRTKKSNQFDNLTFFDIRYSARL